ncbi:HAD family hydrolase [Streptomyces sediminimaris]|uniref:HAD family hydrolase n=1 Tax=Streptomyces sediminimaris TaxID=3383721 RepID=UPI00399BAD39
MGDATDDQDALFSLLGQVKAVLFDFDGPICALFAGRPTTSVADAIKRTAREVWECDFLSPEVELCDDSHDILRLLRGMYESAPDKLSPLPLKAAEAKVADAEAEAVETAEPAPHIDVLLPLLAGLGKRLAIVSNNAAGPIRVFLKRSDVRLDAEFSGVFGRNPDDARLMKPHPDCVERAVEDLSLTASECLLVGDKISDFEAARKAGTRFLGYAQDAHRIEEMKTSGAEVVVASHDRVIAVARKLRADRQAL